MKIEIKYEGQLTQPEHLLVDKLSAEVFPPEGTALKWSKVDWHVLLWEEDVLASHIEIIERTATVGSRPVRLGGIGGVATRVQWRRRGLAEAALKTAQAFLREKLAVEFGLLVCGETLIHYYAKFGWKLLERTMLIDQPQGKVTYSEPIMILPVCKQDWPEGEIDLCGLPW